MSTKIRFYSTAAACAVAVLSILLATVYWATQYGPAFYRRALVQNVADAKQDSDALLREAASLASHLRRPGQWHALFTADQINGWLAYDVHQNHPQLFPAYISEPRVAIENSHAQVAFNWHKAPWSPVVSLETEIYLRETNVLAVRIFRARAGLLPLPLGSLLNDLAAAGQEMGLQIALEQIEGDPLIVITLPWANARPTDQLCLESLEIDNGEIYVAGHTQRGQPATATSVEGENAPSASAIQPQAQAEKSNIQR